MLKSGLHAGNSQEPLQVLERVPDTVETAF